MRDNGSYPVAVHEDAVVAFVSLQMLALIYLQKFALGGSSFPIPVPLFVMLTGLGWMVVTRNLEFAVSRLPSYLIFVACCLWSESLSGGSLPSFAELILLYGTMTLTAEVSEAAYRQVLDRFVKLMIIPACIVIAQYGYQKFTGLGDPISIDRIVPKSMLLQGFFYQAHYPWNSPFSRPNGFFFLEPSFASAFAASAAIVDMTYFHRWRLIALMIAATLLSMGATGIVMLLIATPILLARQTPFVGVTAAIAIVVVIGTAYMLGAQLPLISRATELQENASSGGGRLVLPALQLVRLLQDPSYIFTGDGAGAASPANGVVGVTLMSAWPAVKLIKEYGLLSMVAFIVFYVSVMAGGWNLPLKIALSAVYFFTGGYLLSPALVGLLILLCSLVTPAKSESVRARHLLRQRSV